MIRARLRQSFRGLAKFPKSGEAGSSDVNGMNLSSRSLRHRILLLPDHGGDTVSGGGHPSDSPVPPTEAIDDAFAQDARGHGNVPGVGVPGSRTNPVRSEDEDVSRRAYELWQTEGSPEGRAEEFWFRAEAELRPGAE